MSEPHTASGINPLEFQAAAVPVKIKRRPIKQYSSAQWTKVSRDVKMNRGKGWSMSRIARNMGISLYRVRQALQAPGGYIPAVRNDDGEIIEQPRFIEGDGVVVVEEDSPVHRRHNIPTPDNGSLPPEIVELLGLLPRMSSEGAAYWLRKIALDILPPRF